MKQKKQLAALALAILLALACLSGALAAQGGNVKDGMDWYLNEEGALLITGSGEIPDYEKAEDVPWYSCRDEIRWILLDGEITRVGNYAFAGCANAVHIVFPNTMASIGARAFYQCSALATSKTVKVTHTDAERLPGDVNEDGVVDGRDTVRLMHWLADEINEATGAPFEINAENADVNADGEVNGLDLLRLVKYLAGEEAELV